MLKIINNDKFLKIFLVCLILILSILDAPEYINCVHIGVCEFLEIQGQISNSLKSDNTEHHFHMARDNFFMFLEDLAYSNELAKGLFIFYLPFIQTFPKFSSILKQKKNQYLQKIMFSSFSVVNNTIFYSLELLEISVIRS